MRKSPSIEMIQFAANRLGHLRGRVVFVGGASLDLLLSDPAAPPPRGTEDVDVIVEVVSRLEYNHIEKELRNLGFQHDMMSKVICRWRFEQLVLDVMPTDETILGFGNRWYSEAIKYALTVSLHDDLSIRVISAPYFLATKLEAFDSPNREGYGDYLASRDIADIIALIDGRPESLQEIYESDSDLLIYLTHRISSLVKQDRFIEAISAHLRPDEASQARADLILSILKQINNDGTMGIS